MHRTGADTVNEKPDSPFMVIFNHAWKRVGESVWLNRWEALWWSVYLWHLGFILCGFNFNNLHSWLGKDIVVYRGWLTAGCLLVPIIFSFLMSAYWVRSVHMQRLPTDDTVKTIPIPANTIIAARIAAVLFLNIRLFLPLILTWLIFMNTPPHLMPLNWIWHFLIFRIFTSSMYIGVFPVNPDIVDSWQFFCFGILLTGWFVLPTVWATFWGTLIKRNVQLYILSCIGFIVLPGSLLFAMWIVEMLDVHIPYLTYNIWIGFMSMGWIVLALILYRGAVRIQGRRSG